MRFLYTLALHAYVLISLPKLFKKKQRHRLTYRFPKIEKEGKPIAWIHAVSLGETKAIAPLVEKLKADYRILLSTVTQTGYAEGERSADANWHVYLPFDLPYLIRPIVKRVNPALVVITETDFWFHFQDAAKKAGARLVLVNGKISKRSFKRFLKLPWLAKMLFSSFDLLCLQGKLYEERFLALGVPKQKIVVTGNIKLDAHFEEPIISTEMILTLGSTHDPEERIWIDVLKHFPNLKTYLVPRHPERFDLVAQMLERSGLCYGRASQGADFTTCSVILVDQMGVLKQCYRKSSIAFVGGTLTKRVGGHNILEPCLYAVPVLYGPHLYSQPDLQELMERYKAGIEVSEQNLEQILSHLLEQPGERKRLAEAGARLINESAGALDASFQAITCAK